jgi:hypothetical protein
MAQCEVCGNEYDRLLEIHHGGAVRVFDCFECAIQAMAPVCRHCGCRVIGHGVQAGQDIYCCANCARAAGVTSLADRIHSMPSGLYFAEMGSED